MLLYTCHRYNRQSAAAVFDTHGGSRGRVDEVGPVACGPQRETHLLGTAHKLG